MKADQEQHKASPYRTTTQGVPPPLVTTAFTVQDDGRWQCVARDRCISVSVCQVQVQCVISVSVSGSVCVSGLV